MVFVYLIDDEKTARCGSDYTHIQRHRKTSRITPDQLKYAKMIGKFVKAKSVTIIVISHHTWWQKDLEDHYNAALRIQKIKI